MKVLVFGGREFADEALLFRTLDDLHAQHGFTLLIEGGARGADRLARRWAISRRVEYKTFEADWARYQGAAGPIRNYEMLHTGKPHLAVGFRGGPGTANMAQKIRALQRQKKNWGIELIEIL